jgi:hypothetical protein
METKDRIPRYVQIVMNQTRKAAMLRPLRWPFAVACFLIMLLTALTCCHPKAEAQAETCTYYVSTNGSDNQSGTSEAQAWSSFSHAIGQLDPGDTLCISDGTYHQTINISSRSGTASGPLTIRALHDNQVILESSGTIVRISDSNYITIQGITIEGGNQGVYVIGSKHIILKRIHIFEAVAIGIWFRDKNDDFLVTECRVENMAGSGNDGWGIRVNDDNGSKRGYGIIEKSSFKHGWRAGARLQDTIVDLYDNVFEDWGGDGVRDHGVYYGNGIPDYEDGGGEIAIIEGNIFRNNNHGFGLKISSWYPKQINMIIRNNIFINNGVSDGNCCDGGISIEQGNNGIQVYNNTFYNNVNHAVNIAAYNYNTGKYSRNIKVKNNVFYSNNAAMILIMDDSTEGLEIDYNCYYSTANTKFRTRKNPKDVYSYSSFSAWQNNNVAPWVDEHSLFQDPKLSDPSQEDYTLHPNSPCIDKGTPLPEVLYDFNFIPRPQGNGYDIGAFEYRSGWLEDINEDGVVNTEDVQICVNAVLGVVSNPRADVNRDGKVDSLDIQQVLNKILGT